MMKSNGTLARLLVPLPLCERTAAGGLPLQLQDSSGFPPDSPLIDFVFYFNYYLTEFYHKIFMPSIIFLVLYGLIQPRPMLSHLMLFILSEV